MYRKFALAMLLAAGVAAAVAEEIRSPETHFFHESFGDMTEELQIARDEGKFGVMVMFEANDCPWCDRMKKNIFNRASVQNYFRDYFRIILVNIDGDALITDFEGNEIQEKIFALSKNRIRATPTFMFFDLDGEIATRYTGSAKNIEEFLWLGEYVVAGHYKNEKFIRFKRNKRESS